MFTREVTPRKRCLRNGEHHFETMRTPVAPKDSETRNKSASQVGWPAFKRARRLRSITKREIKFEESSEKELVNVSISSCDIINMSPSRATSRLNKSISLATLILTSSLLLLQLTSGPPIDSGTLPQTRWRAGSFGAVSASLIIGDSAIEIQEVDESQNNNQNTNNIINQATSSEHHQQQLSPSNQTPNQFETSNVVLGTTSDQQVALQIPNQSIETQSNPVESINDAQDETSLEQQKSLGKASRLPSGPLPPLGQPTEDITDGDKRSRPNHDFDLNELGGPLASANSGALSEVLLGTTAKKEPETSLPEKQIAGKVVDFELQSAGGHNKAKIKKKKKKKQKKVKKEKKEEKMFKKWKNKKSMEKQAMEKEEKKHMKKKKEEGKKDKKKWGLEKHGLHKNGKFKKKKWGKKIKKGDGIKKGKKGKKFLKDKGHKNVGFHNVYHMEEWGDRRKWHDIKREKNWDEKSKKWKKKWKKEKGKKYEGDHMKKFEKQKKEGKKYKKANREKYKKFKEEKFKKGKKKKMEEHKKKKESGSKKEELEKEKKKKKKKP